MKSLLLIRHAKSDWNFEVSDFNRPLNSRGARDAPEMGKRLNNKNVSPQLVITSPAQRAISTCRIICQEIGFKEQAIVEEPEIYEASVSQLLEIINQLENDKQTVFLFGHNNGLTDFAVYLTGADIYNIPTCGMVLIEFPFDDWKMVSKETGDMKWFDYPKKES